MDTKTEHIRRTDEEILARMEEYRQNPGTHQEHRIIILNDAITFREHHDVRASARAALQGTLFFAEPDVALDVARLEEFAWLMGRDDVLIEMAHAVEQRGQGWPEVWAFALTLGGVTAARWAEAAVRNSQIVEWAAGLPVPAAEPEPF